MGSLLTLITHRSIDEGIALEIGKESDEYFRACSIIEMNELDMIERDIAPGNIVCVTSEAGNVIVRAVIAMQECYPGLCHMRQGIWANQIVPGRTQSTGAPQYSGILVTVQPAPDKTVLTVQELITTAFGRTHGDHDDTSV